MVECARHQGRPDAELEAHISACQPCRERWEAERGLTSHLRALRITAVPSDGEWTKAVLMREFDAQHRRERNLRWAWGMSAAAAMVLSVAVMHDVWQHHVTGNTVKPIAISYPAGDYTAEAFVPAEEAGEKGFVTVPYSLPPAPGEILREVRAELPPETLARMGVDVEPGWNGEVPADLLVGQDGFTHAVRLSEDQEQ